MIWSAQHYIAEHHERLDAAKQPGRELRAIRWTDIDFAQQDLLINRAYTVCSGTLPEPGIVLYFAGALPWIGLSMKPPGAPSAVSTEFIARP